MGETLLEEVGPNGNIQAVVEADDSVCYFYLFGSPDTGLGMKAVWVRNLIPAPEVLDVSAMRGGSPPANPVQNCRHPHGLAAPAADQLRVVWLPEGNGAALYEAAEMLAIIPPWSGTGGFQGYARDNVGEGPLAWELGPDNALFDRFTEAEEHWRQWDDEDFWPSIQSAHMSHLEQTFGPHSNYYAIDGGEWPPRALVRIPWKDRVVLATIGLSTRPQPNVEQATDRPELYRRIELGVVVPASWPEDAIKNMGRYLSAQSDLPWSRYTWLGAGHTIPCDSWHNPHYEFALLLREHPGAPQVSIGTLQGDPVNLLWFLPVTEAEREAAISEGSEELVRQLPPKRWQDA